MKPVRVSKQTRVVVEALLEGAAEWRYGYDLSRETNLKSGTLYPILMRLAGKRLLETRWEAAAAPGRPPRHLYRLTGAGQRWARELAPQAGRRRALRPAFGERG
ncbi:MAG TPA: helix-turn-helix transcriptional regulator [Terriglobales bacterium]|nr:helix-turn-helix transcriptional regulator [Terriglobales bacterium]